jgi:hypothetical protein
LLFFAFLSKEQLSIGIDQFIPQTKIIKIFPTISNGEFYIQTSATPLKIQVYNSIGIKILDNTIIYPETKIDLSNEKIGMYFIHLISENHTETVKVILTK